ncbi:asparagine synthetase AsnA [Bacillus sp. NRRL B-14911]|uniref:Aspartate--ammonia ligase n=1 Tax=Bacillus infantis NRRL B-14911 TaxID=1367477 RepID=U5LE42_9BACI|nr:asparagine synthase [Bacillus infantis NRRL B-14911]EAR68049.1 asparagine synthetase AsnA [Bacillus sp. NRRL B-14911]OXT18316.1 aspartate--ammonia ligase [Bacillus sp. OG2]PLR74922.1 aspartate--ammonia ligase [Bacillus sp. UMB0728]
MNNRLPVPHLYAPVMNLIDTEKALKNVKDCFEKELSERLNLTKVSAPLLLESRTGINDNLNGVERMATIEAKDLAETLEVVQSLAKWKRMALARYGFSEGEGLYTDMRAIRKDEELDQLHSIYVDQWDWEKVIPKNKRNKQTLKAEVVSIYESIKETEKKLFYSCSHLVPVLPEQISFITSQQLEDMFPDLPAKQREDRIAEKLGAVFIMNIGGSLLSGSKHDSRSPDYDDWNLNGDLIFWYAPLNRSIEISSMGIRVDEKSLRSQLKECGNEERLELPFHKALLDGKLPFTIGGGIGQSRLCMFLLKKAHIGEVQASVWNSRIRKECQDANIPLL